jgi:hypothetical protein
MPMLFVPNKKGGSLGFKRLEKIFGNMVNKYYYM